jgi:pilus assembly protein FimV
MEPTAAGETYGPVRRGDTLWRVASNYIGQSGMDMNQVMLAIQRKNPEAFVNDNINLLMRGATLEMPSAEDVSEISRDRARELVAQQEAAFRMRSSLASTSTPLLAGDSRPASSTSAPAQREASPEPDPVSRLEIVPTSEDDMAEGRPGTGAVPGGEGSEEVDPGLREDLARTEEELISERQQNEYLRERVNELEAQLAEAEGDADGTVQDSDLANLQDRLQSERLAEASAADETSAAETSPSMPSVTTSTPSDEGGPWYSGPMIWIILLVIVIAAAVGWIVNRRRADVMYFEDEVQSGSAVARLAGEAEEILRTLDSDRQKAAESESDAAVEVEPEHPEFSISADATEDFVEADSEAGAVDGEAAADEDDEPVVSLAQARHQQNDGTDARVLDENSSDPEIKLDLARAYISMGDKEAARVILDEVLNLGNELQRSEAQAMMDEL